MTKPLFPAVVLLFFALSAPPLSAQDGYVPEIQGAGSGLIMVEPGEIPDYDTLRFTEGEETSLAGAFLPTLPAEVDDILTTGVVFADVPPTEEYALMSLADLVDVALTYNFRLESSRRNVEIARSNVRSAEAPFIPFVDLVGGSRFSERNTNRSYDEGGVTRQTNTLQTDAGVESGVNLPTGGQVSLGADASRTDTTTLGRFGTDSGRDYASQADIRFIQPLLRGGGMDVGTAQLRSARINEMNRLLADRLTERDVITGVISAYFGLLQRSRELQVSRDAITERLRFLEETQIKYDVGRVDESEILRAETSYLSELERAIGRRRALDDQRESILLLLGLPLDTPVSFIDITDELTERGRVDVPADGAVVEEALNQRLELMQLDLGIALSEIDYQVDRNALLPQLDFDAGYGRSDIGDSFTNSFGWRDSGWDAGLALRIPLINIQRREAAKRSRLSLDQSLTDRLSAERDITQEVLNNRRQVLTTEAQLTVLRRNVEQARKSLELINGRFEVGFASVTEVRLAQDDLFEAETRYSNTLLNYQIALARLYVALGRPLY